MSHAVGSDIDSDYVPLMREELSVTGDDLRAPAWSAEELAPERDFRVAIIGAGMSGILAAHRLRQAGVPFVVFEKNDDVGGTWLENTYPGCRVDVSNLGTGSEPSRSIDQGSARRRYRRDRRKRATAT